MKPRISRHPAPRRRARGRAAAGVAVLAGACVLAAGCAGGPSSSGVSSGQARSLPGAAAAPAPVQAGGTAGTAGLPAGAGVTLTGRPASGQSIIYTASVTIRSRDVSRAAAQASQVAAAAGGYVASESTHLSPRHPGRSTISLQLKIPVSGYRAALAELTSGRLGTQLSLSRQARDVTQAVADVSSRAASAQAAIAQLRALLARAGSVPALLDVQNEINSEEASLEALLAQQRALTGEISYATVTLLLTGQTAPVHRPKPATGFLAGLAAGWHALTRVTVAVLTGLGAGLPFVIVIGILALALWRGRRWLAGRRPRPTATG
jgi:hypothetical protein